ncbi:MAG: hypothetical protein A2Y62_07390 [Candidatus Fischerbacteria bacterium RBG_13_37_8]|uniref:Uncharacterized protein n=1 Tax=Candidatus Fischerbacteria bacterium RBG_13_37_8 TaxID=1817863 RepID=A0A1F5VVJ8_9BACT|nr:MAG: hypothetical protein A2Y62_07390 [Candidatus Fischerbacteria bacterium RBG_13_37_8]
MSEEDTIWQTEEGKYFVEIEEYFSKKRTFPTYLSVKEWFLVKFWYNEGIPVAIIKKAIDKLALREDFVEKRISLFNCSGEVTKQWKDFKKVMVNRTITKVGEEETKMDATYVCKHIDFLLQALQRITEGIKEESLSLVPVFEKTMKNLTKLKDKYSTQEITAIELEELEIKLTELENTMIKKILDNLPVHIFNKMLEDAKETFSRYDTIIGKAAYKKTLDTYLKKSLLSQFDIPRFSIYFDILQKDISKE